MCVETHTRHRPCTHTRFARWDYCSILIPTDRLPATGRACRRYKLKYVDAKDSVRCVECARERVVALNSPTFRREKEKGRRSIGERMSDSVRLSISTFGDSLHSPTSGSAYSLVSESPTTRTPREGGLWKWLKTLAKEPVSLPRTYGDLPAPSRRARWAAETEARSDSPATAPPPGLPFPVEPTTHTGSTWNNAGENGPRSDSPPVLPSHIQSAPRPMTLAELLRTPPPSGERGNGSNAHEPKGDWSAPEDWGVGGIHFEEEGRKKKERWYSGLFKYREGYTGGAV